MPMVALPSPRRARTMPFAHRVRIVETNQPGLLRRVKRQRLAEPVRRARRHFRSQYDGLDAMSRLVDEQRLAIKVK